jgi:[ribosomal protein S5]-alanine N-acetyltransferase
LVDKEPLSLEPLLESHAVEVFDLLQDSRLYTYIPTNPPESLEKLAERYRWLESRSSPDGTEMWLNWVVRDSTGKAVGLLEASILPDRSAMVAYTIFTPFWGRRYGQRSMHQLLHLLAQDYKVAKATAFVDTRNRASILLLERNGFTQTEFIKDADHFKGASSDEFRFEKALG